VPVFASALAAVSLDVELELLLFASALTELPVATVLEGALLVVLELAFVFVESSAPGVGAASPVLAFVLLAGVLELALALASELGALASVPAEELASVLAAAGVSAPGSGALSAVDAAGSSARTGTAAEAQVVISIARATAPDPRGFFPDMA
jgi:hypothetical protein